MKKKIFMMLAVRMYTVQPPIIFNTLLIAIIYILLNIFTLTRIFVKRSFTPRKHSITRNMLNPSLQIKGQWESNISVWFPFLYSQKWNCHFHNRIIMFCLPVPIHSLYLWGFYIFPGSVCLFCCREICGPILGIYKSLTDTWMWKLGLRLHNFQKRNT